MAGCGGTEVADNCSNEDDALSDASFVITTAPRAGDRVTSGFAVKGCSRTFESTVNWRLIDRNGIELASGHSQGGGIDGPSLFSFTVAIVCGRRRSAIWKSPRRTPLTARVIPAAATSCRSC